MQGLHLISKALAAKPLWPLMLLAEQSSQRVLLLSEPRE